MKSWAICLSLPMLFSWSGSVEANDERLSKGRDLAKRLCAVCHMNEGQGEKQGLTDVPSFSAIADRPTQTHEAIVRWLRSAPKIMPNHRLTWDESDSLAEFIMSLRSEDARRRSERKHEDD